ncbi:hypothetical protein GCM10010145_11960 [Streptomyces ruber]|uniref:Uncharacterized protein n=2 Tax=Streptomyces TaxID=1883 RepID=A0A918B8Q5_9ACTN|nr:hypothetical protein [Streptomyces ruber]GGQ44898.1 hypothetical protein GCM10010145_11960 [Streptomyces ruber]
MTNRNSGEVVQGPMTSDGPSVEELRAARPGSTGGFYHRGERGPLDCAVIWGEVVAGDGTVTDDQMAEVRKAAAIGADSRHAAQVAKSFTERRDPMTGQAIRTYEDGRSELVDESRPDHRWRGCA